jgi:hypothetical protein
LRRDEGVWLRKSSTRRRSRSLIVADSLVRLPALEVFRPDRLELRSVLPSRGRVWL